MLMQNTINRKLQQNRIFNAWRSTSAASLFLPAPTSWATCTEKPDDMPTHIPFISHVVEETRPMAPVAAAPRLPTMPASIYCMAMEVSWARIAGRLIDRTRNTFCMADGWLCFKKDSNVNRFIFVSYFQSTFRVIFPINASYHISSQRFVSHFQSALRIISPSAGSIGNTQQKSESE